MEIVAGKREGSNVSEAGCSKLPRVEDQVDVHSSLPLVETKQEKQRQPVPSFLMEVFSVRFLNFDETKLSHMYGCILIKAFPPFVVFSRKQGEPLDIDSKGFIKLQGPRKLIMPSDNIIIRPLLFKYEDSADQFKYNGCQRLWNHIFNDEHDTFMSRSVGSQFGQIEVNYAVYSYGVTADVDVTLTGCRFPSGNPVHGLITAQNSKLGEQGKSILFDRNDGEGISIDVSPCKYLIARLPLLRRKVAVPHGSTLTIGLNIVGTPYQEIAKDVELKFVARLSGQKAKTFVGAACQVNVGVTWSYYKA